MMYRILALLLTLLLAACGPATQTPAGAGSGTPGVSDQEVVIGNQTDLSGELEFDGAGSINGARMRFDEVNEAGGIHGRRIRLIVDDTGLKVPDAVSAVKTLIDQDHVFAMFLSLGIQTDAAALAEETKSDVPNMYPLSGGRSMVEPSSPLKFTARPTYDDEVRAGISYFMDHAGKHKPCVVYDDTGYGHEVLDAARAQLKKMGDKLTMASAQSPGQTDFGGVVDKLQNAACDLVVLGTGRDDSMQLLEAAKKGKTTDAAFLGTDVDYGEAVARLQDDAADGLYVLTPMARLYKNDDLPPKARLWWNDYVEEYGAQPRLDAMEGYRDADLMVTALAGAGRDLTRKSFIKAAEAIKDYTGPFGYHLSFGPDKHKGTSASVLSRLDHGKWKVVEKSINAEG